MGQLPEVEFLYVWNGHPWTNDPRYDYYPNIQLERGEHNRVYLDGVDVSERDITFILTGSLGIIEEFVKEGGAHVIDPKYRTPLRKITRGKVEYTDLRLPNDA
jgi:hypothetical protein